MDGECASFYGGSTPIAGYGYFGASVSPKIFDYRHLSRLKRKYERESGIRLAKNIRKLAVLRLVLPLLLFDTGMKAIQNNDNIRFLAAVGTKIDRGLLPAPQPISAGEGSSR